MKQQKAKKMTENKTEAKTASAVDAPCYSSKSVVTNEDCMDMMKRYPDGFFDLAVVDPPYGIDIDNSKPGNFVMTKHDSKNWDSSPPEDNYWEELFRVSKNQVIFGGNYFDLPKRKG